MSPDYTIDPAADIGHVHLKVADLDRSLAFWRDTLGFEVQERIGDEAAFLSAGGYHHHIGLNTWLSRDAEPPPPATTGLFHVAIRYPTREALAHALKPVLAAGIRLDRPLTTVRARPSTSTTPTRTASSSVGIGHARTGLVATTAPLSL